jgi:hypothetical protein
MSASSLLILRDDCKLESTLSLAHYGLELTRAADASIGRYMPAQSSEILSIEFDPLTGTVSIWMYQSY